MSQVPEDIIVSGMKWWIRVQRIASREPRDSCFITWLESLWLKEWVSLVVNKQKPWCAAKRTQMKMYMQMQTYMYTHMHTYTHAHTWTHTCRCRPTHMHIDTHHMHKLTHVHTHTHTWTHTQIYFSFSDTSGNSLIFQLLLGELLKSHLPQASQARASCDVARTSGSVCWEFSRWLQWAVRTGKCRIRPRWGRL